MASDRLLLIQAEIKRIERSVRIVKKMVAQEIDSTATPSTQSKEDTENGKKEQG